MQKSDMPGDNRKIYITIGRYGRGTYSEKRSDFIAEASHVETEEEALSFLNGVRKKYPDARHHVYAYLLKNNNIMRYSDDGEPQGTGGMPVLDLIRKTGFTDAVIVVTRYFGGILLGTGGLVHAYGTAAKLAVDDAGIKEYSLFNEYSFSVDYSFWQKLSYEIKTSGVKLDSVEYLDSVIVKVALPEEKSGAFINRVSELSAGRVEAVFTGTRFDV
ncbi:MAG: YigZ family protein [Clostridia bacterium]|nr:YigZ family protein [Clostridia bacterium]